MLDATERAGPRRWPRGQKFTLSPEGTEAREAYQAAVLAARAAGRAALDSALAEWATPRAVAPGDGVVLAELGGKPRGLNDLAVALEECGIALAEVRSAVDRLVTAKLVAPVPLASQIVGA